ncbi:MAG: hypothetical protein RLZZ143_985 [Cyanobacteriota bacterium]|jgi:hypothetical protein
MLSTDVRQKSMIKRIEQVVSILMEDRPFFKEELNYSEIVKHLVELFKKIYLLRNLTLCQRQN